MVNSRGIGYGFQREASQKPRRFSRFCIAMARKIPIEAISPTPGQADLLRKRLLQWFSREKRDLPWRRTRDPYAILISEFMLQQTQVATVIPYYERFLKVLPTLRDLAGASENEVLHLWAGLGYYGRARNLHATAKKIMAEYDGKVPCQFADLLFLPGIGRYVAGAVASIAFNAQAPAVDTNVIRVLFRVFALRDDPQSLRTRGALEDLVLRLLPAGQAGDFNQALMELGASVCLPRNPLCAKCPWGALCKAFHEGCPEKFPPPREKPPIQQVQEACAVVQYGTRFFLSRRCRAENKRYRNMWEFPAVVLAEGGDPREALRQNMRDEFALPVEILEEWASIRHQVTHHKIQKRVFLCKPASTALGDFQDDPDISWFTLEEMKSLAMGSPNRKIAFLLQPDFAS